MNTLLHTPEGVRDIYNADCARKLWIEDRMHQVLKSFGYEDIETPSFEFFDIFNKERGSVASKEMFKFFDREGNTLVLRPDTTPQIARIAAKYFGSETAPIKLCYKNKKYINTSSYQGRLKETTDIGAELIGDGTIDSDAEVIVMLIQSLLSTGLTEVQVELGQINYFRGLVEEAGLNQEQEDSILLMIQNKNYFGLEELIRDYHIEKETGDAFLRLPQLFGSMDILDEAYQLTQNKTARAAIDHLKEVYNILKLYGVDKYITFDLGMLNKLKYYTGVMFQAYTYGTGEYIASGGRYDKLNCQFGVDKPSIGFSIAVDYLLIAMNRQKIEIDTDPSVNCLLLFNDAGRENAVTLARKYRKKKLNVNKLHMDSVKNEEFYLDYASKHSIGLVILMLDDHSAKMIDVPTGTVTTKNVSEL